MSGVDATLVVLIAICVLYIVITEVQKLLKGKLQAAIKKSQNAGTGGSANTTPNSSGTNQNTSDSNGPSSDVPLIHQSQRSALKPNRVAPVHPTSTSIDTNQNTSDSNESSSAVQQTIKSNRGNTGHQYENINFGPNNPVSPQGHLPVNSAQSGQHGLKTPKQLQAGFQNLKRNEVAPASTTSNSSVTNQNTSDSNESSSANQSTTKSNLEDPKHLYENFGQYNPVSSRGYSPVNSAQTRQRDLNDLQRLLNEFEPNQQKGTREIDWNRRENEGLIESMIEDNDLQVWPTLTDKSKESLFKAMQRYLDQKVDKYQPTDEEQRYNRYTLVYPSVKHRIKMIRGSGLHEYYNGDHVKLRIDNELYKYFAFQGPTERTIIDYWTVVYQKGLQVVVKLTRDTERTSQRVITKCADYFKGVNEDNRSIIFKNYDGYQNNLIVTLLENRRVTLEEDKEALEIRLFEVGPQFGQRLKTVNIFYPNWNDFSSLDPTALLRFNSFSRGEDLEGVWTELNRKDSSWKEIQDILIAANGNGKTGIHCSAGVGRTGTFMVNDVMISEFLRGAPDFQLLPVLQSARAFRPYLVQKPKQLDTLIEIKLKLFPTSK